jgi:mannonate dehydratase
MADVLMTQAMRWFGPRDPVPLAHIRQAGASEVVTALHHIPNGVVWPREEIAAQRAMIEAAGLGWTTVESVPVHEAIKTAGTERDRLIDQYITTLRHLAAEGITTVTYNFMPLLDWTRTDLAWTLPDGARALRFELDAVAAYDLHLLKRPGAEADYAAETIERAARRFAAMDDAAKVRLERTIIAGLPGSEESFTSAQFLDAIHGYRDTGPDELRANHHAFMAAICPVAEEVGIRMVVHPDDPPFAIFGLPRVVSTEADVVALFDAVPSAANGLCFCTGSFGVRSDNDLPGMVRRLGRRIGFLHLRSVQREPDGAFHEAAHLEGSGDLTAVMAEVVALQRREGRSIVMRPDHGHQMIDDLTKVTNPGYSLLGRMRGLAELRGLERGLIFMGAN